MVHLVKSVSWEWWNSFIRNPSFSGFFSRSTFFWEMIDRKNKDVRTISTTIFFQNICRGNTDNSWSDSKNLKNHRRQYCSKCSYLKLEISRLNHLSEQHKYVSTNYVQYVHTSRILFVGHLRIGSLVVPLRKKYPVPPTGSWFPGYLPWVDTSTWDRHPSDSEVATFQDRSTGARSSNDIWLIFLEINLSGPWVILVVETC